MGDQENKQITVLIAGRPYPLKIQSSDESVIRRIVRDVNEMVSRFQLNYPNRDKQDCLAMTALALSVDLDKAKQAAKTDPELPEKLAHLDELLDQLLFVHQKVDLERGETNAATPPSELADRDKKAMLSAVRAAVNRTRASLDQ